MRTYTVNTPGRALFEVQAVPELAAAVAAVTLNLEALPAGTIIAEVRA